MRTLKIARRLQYISQLFRGSSEQGSLASHSRSHTNHTNAIYMQNAEYHNAYSWQYVRLPLSMGD